MPDIATLGIVVDASQARAAGDELDRFGARGSAAGLKAQLGLNRATQAIRELQAAYRSGALSFAEGLPQLKKLEADAQKFRDTLATLPESTRRAGVSINALRSPLATLATQAIGASSSLGQLSSVLISLSTGTVAASAVLAGIAAIAYAIKLAKADTEAWTKSLEEQRKVVTDLISKWADLGKEAEAATRRGLEAQRTQIQQRINLLSALAITNPNVVKDLIDANIALISVNKAIAELDRQLNDIPKAPFIDWADGVAESIRNIDFAINEVLTGGARLGRNLGALLDPTLVTASGIDNVLANPGPDVEKQAANSAKIAESWQSVSASVANVVTLLANADDATARMLGTTVALVGQFEDAVKQLKDVGRLSVTSTVGLVAGVLSGFVGAFGETPAQRRAREIAQQNTEAIERLSSALDKVAGGLTGNQYGNATGGTAALLNQLPRGLPPYIGLNQLNPSVGSILRPFGLSLTQLKDIAKDLGITLNTDSVNHFIDSLKDLQKALNEAALVTLRSFAGQLDLINRQWALGGVTDPLKKLADLLKLASGSQGSPTLGLLGQFDLSGASGRSAALNFLQQQLGRAQNGSLTTAELGGLTVQQYLDFLSQFGSLLNEANAQIQQTIDNLQSFADSLKLDPSLTTLSPAQQLAEARKQYETVLQAALGGDQTAANRLPDLARQFLTASRSFNASSPAYAADFARVLADTEAVQKLLGAAEDGWKAVEKPLVNVQDNTKSTVERLETLIEVQRVGLQETVDKLDAIRSEMAASVLAQKVGFEGGAK